MKLYLAFLFALLCMNPLHAQTLDWVVASGPGGQTEQPPLCIDLSGNVYVTGSFEGTVDFDPGAGTVNLTAVDEDVYIQKFSPAGTLIWVKQITGPGIQANAAIATDNSGNVIVGGHFRQTADFDPGPLTNNITAAALYDVFILKLDAAGNFIWVKTLPGGNSDFLMDMQVSSNGNIYSVGIFSNTLDFDPGPGTFNLIAAGGADTYVWKLDSSGNFIWAIRTGSASGENVYALAVDTNENIIVAGTFYGTVDFDPSSGTSNLTAAGARDIYIQKLNAAGNLVWVKRIGGPNEEFCLGVVNDAGGDLYLTGCFTNTLDIDPGPGIYNLTGVSSDNTFNLKLDVAGNFIWANSFGSSTGNSHGMSIAVDNAAVYYTGGFPDGPMDFDPGPGTHILTGYGIDSYCLKLSHSGTFLDAFNITPGGVNDWPGYIKTDGTNIYSTGVIMGMADCDPGPGVTNITPVFGNAVYLMKLGWPTTGIPSEPEENYLFTVYPNPAHDEVTISILNHDNGIVSVFNSLGALVNRIEIENREIIFDIRSLPDGIYTLVYTDDKNVATEKLVIASQ